MSVRAASGVDYDALAAEYDLRYADGQRSGTAAALLALADEIDAQRVLEVGCGTGQWMATLRAVAPHVYGLDLSAGMLAQAGAKDQTLRLARGRAARLAYADRTFDLVYCVNAIHHFGDPAAFVAEGARLLRPGGALAVIGMDPRGNRHRSYMYDYFEGVYRRDLARFPSWGETLDWMVAAALDEVECQIVERYGGDFVGRAVLDDPFLRKGSSSQLALLSDAAYAAGLARIEAAIERAEATGRELHFLVDVPLAMISGRVPAPGTRPAGDNFKGQA
jgi:ubiquinone/menaquinone biosynthesis C-methylase UbiE